MLYQAMSRAVVLAYNSFTWPQQKHNIHGLKWTTTPNERSIRKLCRCGPAQSSLDVDNRVAMHTEARLGRQVMDLGIRYFSKSLVF